MTNEQIIHQAAKAYRPVRFTKVDTFKAGAEFVLKTPELMREQINLAPSPRIAQLEQALEKIANMDASRTYRHSCWEMKEIATNALKTDKQ